MCLSEVIIENQPIFSKILNKVNNTSVNSQAYLLVGQSQEQLEKYALMFSKVLICPSKYNGNCKNCNICKRIDNGYFGELKNIKPVNKVIKKDAIIALRDAFQTHSIEGKNLVYIINDVESLNLSAANAILKFLEEPSGNTVAIFTTTNYNMVIDTIVSRCQVIKINNGINVFDNFISSSTGLEEEKIKVIINFFIMIENNPTMALAQVREMFLSVFTDRELLQKAMFALMLIYKDILNYKVGGVFQYLTDEDIKKIGENQVIDKLTKKISLVLDMINKLDYNVNTLLLMDNLLIGIGEIQDGKSNWN